MTEPCGLRLWLFWIILQLKMSSIWIQPLQQCVSLPCWRISQRGPSCPPSFLTAAPLCYILSHFLRSSNIWDFTQIKRIGGFSSLRGRRISMRPLWTFLTANELDSFYLHHRHEYLISFCFSTTGLFFFSFCCCCCFVLLCFPCVTIFLKKLTAACQLWTLQRNKHFSQRSTADQVAASVNSSLILHKRIMTFIARLSTAPGGNF